MSPIDVDLDFLNTDWSVTNSASFSSVKKPMGAPLSVLAQHAIAGLQFLESSLQHVMAGDDGVLPVHNIFDQRIWPAVREGPNHIFICRKAEIHHTGR